ncbi:MAG: hypothetical protein OES79_12925 [Planctomycetota bacterium]|nr:hypothetical protein [Planctomycetota bacterium]
MKFAFLGLDANTTAIAHAVSSSSDHQLAFLYFDAGSDPQVRQAAEQLCDAATCVAASPDWFVRLLDTPPDVVVVAARQDATALVNDFRNLLELELPIVVSHPVNHSAMVYYELEMLAENSKSVLLPYLPLQWHPAVQALRELVTADAVAASAQDLGRLEQITLDRTVRQTTRSELLDLFAGDVDLARFLAGDVTDVAAMHSAADDDVPLPLNVQMNAQNGVLLRWSLTEVDQPPGGQLTLSGSRGAVTLSMDATEDWQLATAAGQRNVLQTWPPRGEGQHGLTELVQRLEALRADRQTSGRQWQDATRGVEVVEALEKSLRKRRLVHLNYEGRGEQEAFKGTMASLGCGLLMALLAITVVSGVVLKLAKEQGLDNLAAMVAKIPYVALGLMVVFLFMQLLRLVIPEKK